MMKNIGLERIEMRGKGCTKDIKLAIADINWI